MILYLLIFVVLCVLLYFIYNFKYRKENLVFIDLPCSKKRVKSSKNKNLIIHSNNALMFDPMDLNETTRNLLTDERNYLDEHEIEAFLVRLRENNQERPERPERLEDVQNVHDTFVQKVAKNAYDTDSALCNDDIIPQIQRLAGNMTELNQEKIKKVLDVIQKRNTFLINMDDTELNILNRVWNNGDDNVKTQVINELIDCVENNEVVCPSGTATRIINAGLVHTPEKMSKTKELFLSEMLNKASMLKEIHQDDTNFKETLMNEYRKDYESVLTEKEIEEVVAPWIDKI